MKIKIINYYPTRVELIFESELEAAAFPMITSMELKLKSIFYEQGKKKSICFEWEKANDNTQTTLE